jgi:PTH1 family peptidyl-tRNA hydrolase
MTNTNIRAIVGLGNPGSRYIYTRHNIGFRVLDEYVQQHHAAWRTTPTLSLSEVEHEGNTLLVIKPLTGMNCSGDSIPFLKKKGITPEQVIVVHDELELPFGKIALKYGGSAKGHNGLRSLIQGWGSDFWRLRCGIGRPEQKEEVPHYVLSNFTESEQALHGMIQQAVVLLKQKTASEL